jgi:hypothetical protein
MCMCATADVLAALIPWHLMVILMNVAAVRQSQSKVPLFVGSFCRLVVCKSDVVAHSVRAA